MPSSPVLYAQVACDNSHHAIQADAAVQYMTLLQSALPSHMWLCVISTEFIRVLVCTIYVACTDSTVRVRIKESSEQWGCWAL